jgi:tetratricopeptide (TPR) repeat protein
LDAYKQAYELDTSFGDPAIYYAAGAISGGQPQLADEILNTQFGTTTINSGILIQAYYNAGDYQSLLPIFESRLEDSADDIQNYVNLAVIYTELGQDAMAIQVLETAATQFPQAVAQLNEIIRQIRIGNPIRP